jgi:NAD(P)-dependent dehydrogenase (short-subunit alcohol dehydrogenase family)
MATDSPDASAAILPGSVLEMFRLTGRTALVTGGSKGLGLVMATALAQAGANIALVSRTESECVAAAERIAAETGQHIVPFVADVADEAQVVRLADETEAAFGKVDILVNNAGINIRGAAAELSLDDWNAVLQINLTAPFLCARTFGPKMAARGWGRVPRCR